MSDSRALVVELLVDAPITAVWNALRDLVNIVQIEAEAAGLDAHYGDHTGGKACGQQVGRRETLALSMIIYGCISLEC